MANAMRMCAETDLSALVIERAIVEYFQAIAKSGEQCTVNDVNNVIWNARIDAAALAAFIATALKPVTRLKVGDRVRVTLQGEMHGLVGEIREAIPEGKRMYFSVLTPGGRHFAFYDTELELVKPAEVHA